MAFRPPPQMEFQENAVHMLEAQDRCPVRWPALKAPDDQIIASVAFIAILMTILIF